MKVIVQLIIGIVFVTTLSGCMVPLNSGYYNQGYYNNGYVPQYPTYYNDGGDDDEGDD